MLVPRIGRLKRIGLRPDFQDEVDQRFERDIRRMWRVPAAPAYVIADAVLGNSGQCMIEQVNAAFAIFVDILLTHLAEQAIVLVRQKRVVELN